MRVARYDFLFLIFLTAFGFSSCISYEQSLILQDSEETGYGQSARSETYKIRSNDLLSISFKTLESSNSQFLEPTAGQIAQPNQLGTGTPQLLFESYKLDEQGRIDVPLIGLIQVLGLTLKEIEMILEDKLKSFSKFSDVSVNLSNFRVTVVGEVNRSGVQYVYENDYNLLQAIANAGDLTDFANRSKVRLVRNEEGEVKTVWLDLTTPEVVVSEYYQLLPGDLIYVEPLKGKINRENSRNISLGVSLVSLAVTLITLFSR